MRLKIAVTKISCLIGKHPYKTSSETVKDIVYFLKRRKKPRRNKYSKIETQLRQTSFYPWYTKANVVTSRMRKIARCVVNKACNDAGVRFNRPINYFSKMRGQVQEPMCIARYERLVESRMTDQQKYITKRFDDFDVVGAIDGICQGEVIEIKCRSSNLKKTPEWELIQLQVYCYILGLPGRLVQYEGPSVKQTKVTLEDSTKTFNELLPELIKKVDEINVLLPNESEEG